MNYSEFFKQYMNQPIQELPEKCPVCGRELTSLGYEKAKRHIEKCFQK
jgi:DNA repair exonuclease SbcCD ATPase subunit